MSYYMQRGQAALQVKNFPQAAEWFLQALAETPKDPQVLASLGQTLCWAGQREKGLDYLRQAGDYLIKKARKSRDTKQALMLVEQLQFWEDYQGALELGKQVIRINKQEVRGFQLLALSYSRLHQNKSALAAARQALNRVPDSPMLCILVANLEITDKQYEKAKQRLENVLQNATITAEEKFRAHKELALALDKLGRYESVFEHLNASADVSGQIIEIKQQDKNLVPDMIKSNTAGFDRDLLGRWKNQAFSTDNPAPVFLVGFMRSGTTLTQEVLGAHPEIFVADETDLIAAMRAELNKMSRNTGTTPEQLRHLDDSGVAHLREFYWHKARNRYGDKIGNRLLLDKTTMNTIDLGLISCIFPDAKVIFVMRDPRDVCLSCFMQIMTPTASTVQLLSWQETAGFYALIMDWWLVIKKRMPVDFIEFRYEDAIHDFEGTYRKIFDFINLAWDPAVADFHKNAAKRFIVSPSFNQVSQPLYASSVARWRHYEPEFNSIMAILQPFINEFGYE